MALLQIDIRGLPTTPLDAAAEFYANELPEIRDDSDILEQHDLVIVFEPAGDEHHAWRLAAIQELARDMAPRRVNGIVGADASAILETIAYLDVAPGVTGQLLSLQSG